MTAGGGERERGRECERGRERRREREREKSEGWTRLKETRGKIGKR